MLQIMQINKNLLIKSQDKIIILLEEFLLILQIIILKNNFFLLCGNKNLFNEKYFL